MTIQGQAFGLFVTTLAREIQVGRPVITGLTGGVAEIGSTVGAELLGQPATGQIVWQLDGVPIAGQTSQTLVVPVADTAALSLEIDGQVSEPVAIRYPVPQATGALPDQILTQGTSTQTLAAAGDFSFGGTPYFSLTHATSGVTVDPATGVVSFDTDMLSVQTNTSIALRLADAAAPTRFAESGFSLTVAPGADVTAPMLSGATASATGQTSASWAVTSNEAGGVIRAALRPAGVGVLSRAEIEAGSGAAQATSSDLAPAAGSGNGGSFNGLSANTAYVLDVFQRDAAGNESAVISSAAFTTDADVPGVFGSGNWSIADAGTGGDATLTVVALPDSGGSPITGLFTRIGGSGPVALGGAGTGSYPLNDLFTDGAATTVVIFARNAAGDGPESAGKTVTTTAPAIWAAPGVTAAGDGAVTLHAGGAAPPAPAAPTITATGDGSVTLDAT